MTELPLQSSIFTNLEPTLEPLEMPVDTVQLGAPEPAITPTITPAKRAHNRVLVFDTETTGLIPRHVFGTPFPPDNMYPHIIQISYVVFDIGLGKVVDSMNAYVRPPGHVQISAEVERITGISMDTVLARGQQLAPLLLRLYDASLLCDCIVAHNIHFDITVVRKEMYRQREALKYLTMSPGKTGQMIQFMTKKFCEDHRIATKCTMMTSIQRCNLWYVPSGALPTINADGYAVDPAHRLKMPKLAELYDRMFDSPPPKGLHNSMVDVLVCLQCFLALENHAPIPFVRFRRMVESVE